MFSYNIIVNYYKSFLQGGSEKEGFQDISKIKFIIFINYFINLISYNPLVRFSTIYIANNVFLNYNNKALLYDNIIVQKRAKYAPDFQYNIGLYNILSVLILSNYFDQIRQFLNNKLRIFIFSNLITLNNPVTLYSLLNLSAKEILVNPNLESLAVLISQLNSKDINLIKNIANMFSYYLSAKDNSVKGNLIQSCVKFSKQVMFWTFKSGADILIYVNENAGQLGRNKP